MKTVKVPAPNDLADRARRNLDRERERLRRRGVAEDALECLLRLVPDEPTSSRAATGLPPLVQMLAERTAEALQLRARRNLAAATRVFELGLAGLGLTITRPAGQRNEFLGKLLTGIAANLDDQPETLTPAERLEAAVRPAIVAATLIAAWPTLTGRQT